MTSKKVTPQLDTKSRDPQKPITQIIKAISLRGIVRPHSVSLSTVDIASTKEKAVSIPRVNRVKERTIDHKLENCMVSIAAGYATKAKPRELMLSATGEPSHFKYPTTEKTAKMRGEINLGCLELNTMI